MIREMKTHFMFLELNQNIKIKINWFSLQSNPTTDQRNTKLIVNLETNYYKRLVLHWACYKESNQNQWAVPSLCKMPLNTIRFNDNALQTEFSSLYKGARTKVIDIVINQTEGEEEDMIIGLVFVLYSPEDHQWYNNNNHNYHIKLTDCNCKGNNDTNRTVLNNENIIDIPSEIVKCETKECSWTLMHRYNKCNDLIHFSSLLSQHNTNQNYLWVYIWLILANQKHLDWQRNYNFRPKEIGDSMNKLAHTLTFHYINTCINTKYSNNVNHFNDVIMKMILSQIGKGEGDGSLIRTKMLEMIHKYNLKQTKDRFYSQWYQKLQNNNSIEDVTICQALINYLRSGDINEYNKTLEEGCITHSRLHSYERPITLDPKAKLEYINDFEQILHLLKCIHSRDDLPFLYESVKNYFGSIRLIEDLINNNPKSNKNLIEDIGKLVKCRSVINRLIKRNIFSLKIVRDLIYLDNCIEPKLVKLISQETLRLMSYYSINNYIKIITLILDSLSISYPKYTKLLYAYNSWMIITSNIIKEKTQTPNQKLLFKLYDTCHILSNMLSYLSSLYIIDINKKAQYLGHNCNLNVNYYNNFSNDLFKNSIIYPLSLMINGLQYLRRKQIAINDWIIINKGNSNNRLRGRIIQVKGMEDVKDCECNKDIIIITEGIKRVEDIPFNCKGIILYSSDDDQLNLNSDLFLIQLKRLDYFVGICFQLEQMQSILNNKNQNVRMKIESKGIIYCKLIKQIIPIEKKMKCIKAIITHSFPVHQPINNNKGKQLIINPDEEIKQKQTINNSSLLKYYLSKESNKEVNQVLTSQLSLLSNENSYSSTNNILTQCKSIIMDMDIPCNDIHSQNIAKRLIEFGFSDNEIAESINVCKCNWASLFSMPKTQLVS